MLVLVFKRALSAIPVLWIVATLTFLMVRIVPGGPFDLDKALPPEVVANAFRWSQEVNSGVKTCADLMQDYDKPSGNGVCAVRPSLPY